jgi:hypothetical protein
MTSYDVANILAFACFVAACFRARWVALALLPPVALILARTTGLVDTSSASHPLRWAVPVAGLLLAAWAAWRYTQDVLAKRAKRRKGALSLLWGMKRSGEYVGRPSQVRKDAYQIADNEPRPFPRRLLAAILVFGSDCADLPGLLLWRLPGDWVVIPLQIAACASILAVLLIPERWLMKWNGSQ